MPTRRGALVVSLDFELHWGMRDKRSAKECAQRLLGSRQVVPRLLDLFLEREIHATWATVGFLFSRTRQDLEEAMPRVRPEYFDRKLSPYDERIGEDEAEDPLHYAASLTDLIRACPHQELATHTLSHFYCLA